MRPASLLRFTLLMGFLFFGVSCKKSEKDSPLVQEEDVSTSLEEDIRTSLQQGLATARAEIAKNNGALSPDRWRELIKEATGTVGAIVESEVILVIGQPDALDANASSARKTLTYYNRALATTDYRGTKQVQHLEIDLRDGVVVDVRASGDR